MNALSHTRVDRYARRPASRRLSQAVRASVEPLEARVFLSAVTYAVSTPGDHTLLMQLQGSSLVITDNGVVQFNGDMSTVDSVAITGGAGNDVLIVDESNGNPLPSGGTTFDGAGGANSVVLQGGSGFFEVYSPTSGTSGNISLGGGNLTYANVGGITDTTPVMFFTLDTSSASEQVNVVDGPVVNGFQTTEVNGGSNPQFATTDFANKQNATVNTIDGSDTVTLNNPAAATGMSNFTLDTYQGADVVNVLATSAAVTTTVTSSAGFSNGDNTILVGGGSVQNILGTLVMTNSPDFNDVVVDDSADAVGRTATLDNYWDPNLGTTVVSITGLSPGMIEVDPFGTGSFVLNGGSGGNTFNVNTDIVGSPSTLNAGAGSDVINVGYLPGGSPLAVNGQGGHDAVNVAVTLVNGYPSLLGTLSVSDPGGSVALSVDTTAETSAQAVVVGAGSLSLTTTLPSGTTTSNINYSLSSGSLLVHTGSSADRFTVNSLSVPTTLDGGDGSDSYNVALNASVPLSLLDSGTSGSDGASLAGPMAGTSYVLGPTGMTAGAAVVNYDSGLEQLSLTAGPGSDSFSVTPSAATTFTLDGAAPTTAPGDTISIVLGGATGAELNPGPSGQGNYTFANRDPVNYVNMETANQPVASADLSLAFTSPTTVLENGLLTYSFTVTNNGSGSASNVVLTASLPAGATFESATLGQGSYTLSSGNLVLNLGAMANGATVSGTITVLVADEGAATSAATVSSDVSDPNTADNSASASATVLDAPLTASGNFSLSAVEGQMSALMTVATFVDTGGAESLGDYQAMISWGDGASSAGTITYDPQSNTFSVSGSHLYAAEGSYTASVVITHDSAPAVSVSDAVNVADPAVVATGGLNLSSVEGASGNFTVATFTDPGGADPLSDYSAAINWGDGSAASVATVTFDAGTGVFSVAGSHLFATAGSYTATVTLHHAAATDVQVTDTMAVSDPAVIMTSGMTLSSTEGAMSSSQVVATFTDPAGAEDLSHYSAAITWGDGSTSAGAISFNAATGVFSVAGSHLYATAGSFPVSVAVHHDSAPDAGAASTAVVSDLSVVATGGLTINSTPNSSTGTQTLATFTDPGGAEGLSHYSATIAWGDGTSGAGTISFNSATGVFTVQGAHTYGGPGGYTLSVTIHHDSAVDVTVTGLAQVASKAAPKLSNVAATSITEGATTTLTGKISSPGGGGAMTLTVNWGPGQGTSSYSLPANANSFSVSHKYLDNAAAPATGYPLSLTISNSNGSSTASATAPVSNVAPTAGALTGPGSLVRGQSFDLAGSFTDPGVLDTHTVKFDWGDGSTSAGVVTEANGSGTFTAGHVFTASGTYNVVCTITDKDGGFTTVSKTIAVTDILLENDPVYGGTMLALGGTTGNDTISVKSNHGGNNLKVTVNSNSVDASSAVGRIVVFAQAGNDNVQFAKDVMNPVFVYGGAGNDTMVGGGGSDVFVGGDGNDLLMGGSSRNVLIGGRGSDMLLGGGADDILIAGYTSLDNSDAALAAVFNEWTRATVPYATRVADLSTGGGLNGSVVLNSGTVFNDNASDILMGNGGSDWFLSSSNDVIVGRTTGLVRTRV